MSICSSRPSASRMCRALVCMLAGMAFLFTACSDDPVNGRPVAVLGPDFDVQIGETVTMDGTDSEDPEGAELDYTWSFASRPAGSTASLSSTTGPTTSFVADVEGMFVVQLIVDDGHDTSAPANCTVTAVNAPPTATINSPVAGDVYDEGQTISFSGSATDPEDGPLSGSSLVWTSNLDGQIGVGASFTRDDLSVGDHVITLTATDNHGATGEIAIAMTVNAPPTATIDSPVEGEIYDEGQAISFSGSATDPEEGPLSGSSLMWTSSLDGSIGTGTSFAKSDLSVGDHSVVLSATDGDGATGTATVEITVQPTELQPEAGYYSGTTSEGHPVSFRVSSDGSEIESGLKIKFDLVCQYCTGTSEWTLYPTLSITSGSFSYTTSKLELNGNVTSSTSFSGSASYMPGYDSYCGNCYDRNVTWTTTWQSPTPPPPVAGVAGEALPENAGTARRVRTEQDDCTTVLEFFRKEEGGNQL